MAYMGLIKKWRLCEAFDIFRTPVGLRVARECKINSRANIYPSKSWAGFGTPCIQRNKVVGSDNGQKVAFVRMRRATALLVTQCKVSTANMAPGGQQATVEVTCQE